MLAPLTPLLSPLIVKKEVISNVNLEPMQEETKPEKRKNTEQDSRRNKKLKSSKEINRVKDNLTPEEPSQKSDNKESSKLREEGSKLKHRAEKLYKRSSHIPIALQMYIQAGLKFMESASYMEVLSKSHSLSGETTFRHWQSVHHVSTNGSIFWRRSYEMWRSKGRCVDSSVVSSRESTS